MQITLTLSKNGKDKKKRKGQLKINALLNFFDAVELPPLPGIDPSQYTKNTLIVQKDILQMQLLYRAGARIM